MANVIQGVVTSIGDDGRLVSDIANENVQDLPEGDSVVVKFGGHETLGVFPQDHGQPDSTMVASRGASGCVEIEIVGIPLASMLGIKVGESIEIAW